MYVGGYKREFESLSNCEPKQRLSKTKTRERRHADWWDRLSPYRGLTNREIVRMASDGVSKHEIAVRARLSRGRINQIIDIAKYY